MESEILRAGGDVQRARIDMDTRPLGACPGQPGRIVTGFKDCKHETLTKRELEARLTTLVQACIISPDVAQLVMDRYSEFPKTITMDVLRMAWYVENAWRWERWEKARAKVAALTEALRLAEIEETTSREGAMASKAPWCKAVDNQP